MQIDVILSWVGAAVAIIAAVAGIVKSFRTTPGERADVASKYMAIATEQAEQIRQLKREMDALEIKMDAFEHGVRILLEQLCENNIPPKWEPDKPK